VKLENIDIDATLNEVEHLLKEDEQVSPALKAMITLLVTLVKRLTNRIGLNSKNSSKPPSTDSDQNIHIGGIRSQMQDHIGVRDFNNPPDRSLIAAMSCIDVHGFFHIYP